MHVVMVCLGNICRSPMAAAVLDNQARRAGLDITVSSAGTADYHVGEGPHPMSLRVWSDAGYSYEHTASLFTTATFDTADLVLVMDASNHRNVMRVARTPEDAGKVAFLRSYDPALRAVDPVTAVDRLTVPDPWGHPRVEFENVLAMVESAVAGLVAKLAQSDGRSGCVA